jgi:hypothetical protein
MPAGRCLLENIRALTLSALLLCTAQAGLCLDGGFKPSPDEVRLSVLLTRYFGARLARTAAGRDTQAMFSPRHPLPPVYFNEEEPGRLGYFDGEYGSIFLNAKTARAFLGLKNKTPQQLTGWLLAHPKSTRRLCASADSLYLHELVHASQMFRFPAYASGGSKPVEFEYEAYLAQDRYMDESLRLAPERLEKYFTAPGHDIYLESALATYLSMSLDMEKYRALIRERYMDDDSQYYCATSGAVALSTPAAAPVSPAELDANLNDFYKNDWPDFSAGALLFVGKIADEIHNYPLALQCLAVARPQAAAVGVDPAVQEQLQSSAELAILHTSEFIRENAQVLDIFHLGELLTAVDKACADTARPFPPELEGLRARVYPQALALMRSRAKKARGADYRRYYSGKAEIIKEWLDKAAPDGAEAPKIKEPAADSADKITPAAQQSGQP